MGTAVHRKGRAIIRNKDMEIIKQEIEECGDRNSDVGGKAARECRGERWDWSRKPFTGGI